MIVLLWSAVVIVIIALSPTQAWGECAWVLWLQETQMDGARPLSGNPQPWRVQESFESLAECRLGMKKQITELAAAIRDGQPSVPVTTFDSSVMIIGAQGRIINAEYKCLPDSIDPRGTKGNAR